MDRRIFWGALVILIGALLLLEATGVLNVNVWKFFWGGVLILVGIGVMFPDKRY